MEDKMSSKFLIELVLTLAFGFFMVWFMSDKSAKPKDYEESDG